MENLKNEWDIWFHSINDNNWDKSSYKKIYTINNLFDFQYIKTNFQQDHYQNGMFFCMKENIFPNWEDPDNRNGGCLSFKIPSTEIIKEWSDLLLTIISEKLVSLEYSDEINGISISPKKEFNIIKIWFKNSTFDYKKEIEEYSLITFNNALYKKHEISH